MYANCPLESGSFSSLLEGRSTPRWRVVGANEEKPVPYSISAHWHQLKMKMIGFLIPYFRPDSKMDTPKMYTTVYFAIFSACVTVFSFVMSAATHLRHHKNEHIHISKYAKFQQDWSVIWRAFENRKNTLVWSEGRAVISFNMINLLELRNG